MPTFDLDLDGLIPATLLPLTADYEIDEPALRAYIRWLLSFHGLKALAVNMDTGEGPHLSRDERRRVLDIYVDEVAGRLPLLAGVSARYTAEAIDLARDGAAAGAAGLVIFPIPAFAGEPLAPEVPFEYHSAIADAVPLPMVLFQLQPALAGVLFSRETLLRLVGIPTVVAIKEASFDAVRFVETRRILDEAPRRITLLTGNDNFIFESFLLGSTGALIGFGTIAIAEQIDMIARCAAGDLAGASRINDAVVKPLADALFASPVRNYRARLKEGLRQMGVIPNAPMRPPLLPLNDQECAAVSAALARVRVAAGARVMATPIGVGVVGAGDIAHSHLLAYRSRTNRDLGKVVALADIDEARAKAMAETYDIERTYPTIDAMLADPAVNAVSICTPPFLHVQQSVSALQSGKHVLCEKPVSPTLAGLDEIAAERSGGATFCGVFQHRVGQGARQVKALIEAGEFGPLRFGLSETLWQRGQAYYDVWWRGTWEQECGGVTMGHGIHSIDMLAWLMGEPASLIADAQTLKLDIVVEDTSLATVRFRNGAIGQIIVTVNAQDNRSRLEIFGEHLQAVSSESAYDPTRESFRLTSTDPERASRAAEEAARLYPETPKHLHVEMVNEFLRAINEQRAPLVTIDECRRSMSLITGMYKSAMTGQRVTFPIAPDDPFYSKIPPDGSSLPSPERAAREAR